MGEQVKRREPWFRYTRCENLCHRLRRVLHQWPRGYR